MNAKELRSAREGLRRWLIKWTDCSAMDGWPCDSCTTLFLGLLLDDIASEEYKTHNHPPDRINEIWRAIIQIKNAKYKEEDNG